MTEDQIREWYQMLGRTAAQQAVVIRELLVHANGDEMSSADRVVCRKALLMLEHEQYAARRAA